MSLFNSPALESSETSTHRFPALRSTGQSLNAKQLVEPGTGFALLIGYTLLFAGFLIGALLTTGILLIGLLIAPIADYLNRKKVMALLRGSAIEAGPNQFPEIHQCVCEFSERLGMRTPPALFIVESNSINAAAMRIGHRRVIVLNDDLVDACLRSGDAQTLAFIIAHELSHLALGHTNLIRMGAVRCWRKISRLDEFTCDAVANHLVGNPQTSAKALVTLLSGPQLLRYVNFSELYLQASKVVNDRNSVKAERRLTHPLLLRRIQRFLQ